MGMQLGEALYAHLAGTVNVSSHVATRIYPLVAPQGASLPFLTFQEISNLGVHAMSKDPKIRHPRYQVSIFANNYSSARAVAKEVKTALQDYQSDISGLLGDGTSGVDVQRVFFENEIDLHAIDPETAGGTYHIAQDYICWHTT